MQPARFVLLRHDWPEPHRDLIYETTVDRQEDFLPTWALYSANTNEDAFPPDRTQTGRAIELEPHRRAYLDYEGPVSGGRGRVEQECRGTVVRSEHGNNGDTVRLEVVIISTGGRERRGEILIEPRPSDSIVRLIQVSSRHAQNGLSGHVFEWRPVEI
jgi:hypothetical protein